MKNTYTKTSLTLVFWFLSGGFQRICRDAAPPLLHQPRRRRQTPVRWVPLAPRRSPRRCFASSTRILSSARPSQHRLAAAAASGSSIIHTDAFPPAMRRAFKCNRQTGRAKHFVANARRIFPFRRFSCL
jgi:hypothetical protein